MKKNTSINRERRFGKDRNAFGGVKAERVRTGVTCPDEYLNVTVIFQDGIERDHGGTGV